jgi:putative transposase
LGLTAGPVPARVDAGIKLGLLQLIDHAIGQGWSARRACGVLELNDRRVSVWQSRRAAGLPLKDAASGPAEALHSLLDWERAAILELFDDWAEIDRSHRKLAHRGSRLGKVFVSESSVLRVLQAENLVLPVAPARDPAGPRKPWPEWVEYRPCQVWGHDFTAFMRAGRDALAILDLVSRKWITTLLVPHGRGESVHVQAIYTRALELEGLLEIVEQRMIEPNADELLPVLLAVSDGGPQMVSGTTREFMALHALAMHVGRPGTPTDQAHIESFFGHVKHDWAHLEAIRDPDVLATELDKVRLEYNSVRLHAGIGYVTPDDEHEGRGDQIRKARHEGMRKARAERIAYRRSHPSVRT